MNRNALMGLVPMPVRLFYKEKNEPRWIEMTKSQDELWKRSDRHPLFVRGCEIRKPWMIDLDPINDRISAVDKWEFYDAAFEMCKAAGFATLFVSGTDDRYRLTHIVAPRETDAVLLDAYVCNAAEDLRTGAFHTR